jgi:hypothetical protein
VSEAFRVAFCESCKVALFPKDKMAAFFNQLDYVMYDLAQSRLERSKLTGESGEVLLSYEHHEDERRGFVT